MNNVPISSDHEYVRLMDGDGQKVNVQTLTRPIQRIEKVQN